jgi:hypothetical protein
VTWEPSSIATSPAASLPPEASVDDWAFVPAELGPDLNGDVVYAASVTAGPSHDWAPELVLDFATTRYCERCGRDVIYALQAERALRRERQSFLLREWHDRVRRAKARARYS